MGQGQNEAPPDPRRGPGSRQEKRPGLPTPACGLMSIEGRSPHHLDVCLCAAETPRKANGRPGSRTSRAGTAGPDAGAPSLYLWLDQISALSVVRCPNTIDQPFHRGPPWLVQTHDLFAQSNELLRPFHQKTSYVGLFADGGGRYYTCRRSPVAYVGWWLRAVSMVTHRGGPLVWVRSCLSSFAPCGATCACKYLRATRPGDTLPAYRRVYGQCPQGNSNPRRSLERAVS